MPSNMIILIGSSKNIVDFHKYCTKKGCKLLQRTVKSTKKMNKNYRKTVKIITRNDKNYW